MVSNHDGLEYGDGSKVELILNKLIYEPKRKRNSSMMLIASSIYQDFFDDLPF
jgi:hypothetical protein